jgi:hypothetical protein
VKLAVHSSRPAVALALYHFPTSALVKAVETDYTATEHHYLRYMFLGYIVEKYTEVVFA